MSGERLIIYKVVRDMVGERTGKHVCHDLIYNGKYIGNFDEIVNIAKKVTDPNNIKYLPYELIMKTFDKKEAEQVLDFFEKLVTLTPEQEEAIFTNDLKKLQTLID